MSILKHLGIHQAGVAAAAPAASASSDVESIRRISAALDRLDPQRARWIAGFAFVLSRVAGADLDISPEEVREMERLVEERIGLPEDQAVLVVEIAKRQNLLFGGTDNFLVTRALKETAGHDEKMELIRCLFAVSAANDSISSVEEATIAQIASELGIDRRELVEIRTHYRDKRSVMKDLPG